jgi:hypothetical protein
MVLRRRSLTNRNFSDHAERYSGRLCRGTMEVERFLLILRTNVDDKYLFQICLSPFSRSIPNPIFSLFHFSPLSLSLSRSSLLLLPIINSALLCWPNLIVATNTYTQYSLFSHLPPPPIYISTSNIVSTTTTTTTITNSSMPLISLYLSFFSKKTVSSIGLS